MRQFLRYVFFYLFIIAFVVACNKKDGAISEKSAVSDSLGFAGGSFSGGSGTGGGGQAGVLTAGEWNDFSNWNFWNTLMANDTFGKYQTTWGFYCKERWTFKVSNNAGQPVVDAVVVIKKGTSVLWTGRTDNKGVLHIIPNIYNAAPFTGMIYEISFKNQLYSTGMLLSTQPEINLTINTVSASASNLDIMFVVDATGSMSDEINYLKTELADVLNRADNQISGSLRYGSVFYRDFGDAYVTKVNSFTNSKSDVVSFVNQQNADGGGDYPEAVEEAMKAAVQQNWSSQAKARIIFLVLDAPPHNNVQQLNLLRQQVQIAAAKGIIIIPVAASGVDKSTEFLCRFMAMATNGTYTFLTNHSGVGGNHITPTIGSYNVEYLNNLMVRLITQYGN